MVDNLILGFSTLATTQNILYCLLGCFVGTLIGVLPGVGTVATLSILLPFTYGLGPVTGLIMMAGIYYGAQYGGSTTSILLNTPGEPSSIMTCIDGNAMTKKGKAGNAIFAAGLSSFIAGCITVFLIALMGSSLAEVGFKFGPAEYCNLMLLGILGISFITNRDIVTGFALGCVGMLLGFIGTDPNSSAMRYIFFNLPELSDGIGVVPIAIGLFGIAEIFKNLLHPPEAYASTEQTKVRLTKEELTRLIPSALRGTAIGSFLGLIPGGGAMLATFIAYMTEKRVSKYKEEMGSGAIEGVAAPEAANNAAAQTNFIPLLVLGMPENAVMSLMLAALVIAGVQPGPMVINQQPELFWALTCSMIVGNFILLIMNVPFATLWIKLLKIPRLLLYPGLLIFSLIGAYSINNSMFDVYLALLFGVVGYAFSRMSLEPAPLILGYILGPMFEEYSRRALFISRGDFEIFYRSPIAITILTVTTTLVLYGIYRIVNPKAEKGLTNW